MTGSCSSRVAVNYSGPSERSYCTTISAYPGGTTVSGTATYTARNVTSSGLSGTTTRPIRFAELEILNSSGKRVQCGETAADGTFTNLQVPIGTSDLTIRVNSRANNENELRASVLNCPEENGVYAVEGTFTPSGPQTVNLLAAHDGEVLGGAFNILDQLYDTNEFLRNRVGNCNADGATTTADCTPVTTSAPKVKAYWEKGFNPNNYFGSSSPVSFYIPGASRLFILGGEGGDFDNEDTDHFDNSVVIHEYGHFLEDIYSTTDSPGGSHSGNKVIDPRLAWSEGWGDFIQGAVRDDPYYYDTVGSGAGTIPSSATFAIPIEYDNGIGSPYRTLCGSDLVFPSTSGCDKPKTSGEGNFREFSVTRILWDIADGGTGNTSTNGDGTSNEFLKVWKAMTSTDALKSTFEEFRAIGILHAFAEGDLGSGTWSALRTTHKHGLTEDYAHYVHANASCGAGYLFTMDPATEGSDNGSFETSNLAVNNDFYFLNLSASQSVNIKLTYETVDQTASGKESDLDLFVYNSNARYGNAADMKIISQNYFDDDVTTPEEEQTTKSLSAGKYLINVKTYTGENTSNATIGEYAPGEMIDAGTAINYKLTINGVPVCPTAKP